MSNDFDVIPIFGHSNSVPYSVHCLVTTRCSLKCPGCFYMTLDRHNKGEWSWEFAKSIADQCVNMGVRWLAIGGGEPSEWKHINAFTVYAKEYLGLKVAVTTNGRARYPFYADTIHVSYDRKHTIGLVDPVGWLRDTIGFYKKVTRSVGINTVLSDVSWVDPTAYDFVDHITIVQDKPLVFPLASKDECQKLFDAIPAHVEVTIDGCLNARITGITECSQGVTSMSIDPIGRFSACSNSRHKIVAASVKSAWNTLRLQCDEMPKGCLLTE